MWAKTQDMTLRLARGRPLALRQAGGTTIEVLSGAVWLTETGVPGDHWARPGERLEVRGAGLVVIEALAGAELRLCPPAPAAIRPRRRRASAWTLAPAGARLQAC